MKKVILGVLIGIAVLVGLLYFGGSKYIRSLGSKTEYAGEKLQKYEKPVQDTAKTVGKTVGGTYDKTKETVKGYMK